MMGLPHFGKEGSSFQNPSESSAFILAPDLKCTMKVFCLIHFHCKDAQFSFLLVVLVFNAIRS